MRALKESLKRMLEGQKTARVKEGVRYLVTKPITVPPGEYGSQERPGGVIPVDSIVEFRFARQYQRSGSYSGRLALVFVINWGSGKPIKKPVYDEGYRLGHESDLPVKLASHVEEFTV